MTRWSLDAASYRWAHITVHTGTRLLVAIPVDRQPAPHVDNRRSVLAMHDGSCNPDAVYGGDVPWRPADAVMLGARIDLDWHRREVVVSLGLRAYRAASFSEAVEGLLGEGVVA